MEKNLAQFLKTTMKDEAERKLKIRNRQGKEILLARDTTTAATMMTATTTMVTMSIKGGITPRIPKSHKKNNPAEDRKEIRTSQYLREDTSRKKKCHKESNTYYTYGQY